MAKSIFKKKAPEANANFNVFESQCPKIRILWKALKAKLSKYPQWSRQSVDTSQLLDHPSQWRSMHPNVEVCHTSSVWLESESILRKLPRVSEVATNHWVFSKLWLVTWFYLILLPILG